MRLTDNDISKIENHLQTSKDLENELLKRGGNISTFEKTLQLDIEMLLEEVKHFRNMNWTI